MKVLVTGAAAFIGMYCAAKLLAPVEQGVARFVDWYRSHYRV